MEDMNNQPRYFDLNEQLNPFQYTDRDATIGRTLTSAFVVNPLLDSLVKNSVARNHGLGIYNALRNGGFVSQYTFLGGHSIFGGKNTFLKRIPGINKLFGSPPKNHTKFFNKTFGINYISPIANEDYVVSETVEKKMDKSGYLKRKKKNANLAEGVAPEKHNIELLESGYGFGRRLNLDDTQMNIVSKALSGKTPEELAGKGAINAFNEYTSETMYFFKALEKGGVYFSKEESGEAFSDIFSNAALKLISESGSELGKKSNQFIKDYKIMEQYVSSVSKKAGNKNFYTFVSRNLANPAYSKATEDISKMLDDVIGVIKKSGIKDVYEIAEKLNFAEAMVEEYGVDKITDLTEKEILLQMGFLSSENVSSLVMNTIGEKLGKEGVEMLDSTARVVKASSKKTITSRIFGSKVMRSITGVASSGLLRTFEIAAGIASAVSSAQQEDTITGVTENHNFNFDQQNFVQSQEGDASVQMSHALREENYMAFAQISSRNISREALGNIDAIDIDQSLSDQDNFTIF